MKSTSIISDSTRIIPAQKNKATSVKKSHNGDMEITFKNGITGTLKSEDVDLQAFAVWTMLNPDCTK